MPTRLFLDFDGTLTIRDVGDEFFFAFGGKRCTELIEQYHAGRLSAQECFRGETEAMGALDPAVAEQFLTSMEVRAGLSDLLDFCRQSGIEVCILSDGLDFYIRTILDRAGVSGVPFFSNVLLFPHARGHARPPVIEFPFTGAECDHCGCCKRNLMLRLSHDRDVTIYVGDGFSDQCAVQYADVVFARGALQTFCREENISYYHFDTMDDVRARLENLLMRRKIRKRHRAEVRRRELYIAEA